MSPDQPKQFTQELTPFQAEVMERIEAADLSDAAREKAIAILDLGNRLDVGSGDSVIREAAEQIREEVGQRGVLNSQWDNEPYYDPKEWSDNDLKGLYAVLTGKRA